MSLDSVGRAKAESTLTLIHPATGAVLTNEDQSEMTVTIYGEYSDVYQSAFHERTRLRIEKARTTGETHMSYQDMEDETFEMVCACTKEWNLTTDEGPVEFSRDKAREIYKTYPWVYRQVRGHMENAANFLDRSDAT